MPLAAGAAASSTGLAGLIKTKVLQNNEQLATQIGSGGDLDWLFDSIAAAVVEHIQSSAEIGPDTVINDSVGAPCVISSSSIL